MNFDYLELQKNIEEKRLIWGRKLEIFLLSKLGILCDFFWTIFINFYKKNYATALSCIFIISLSELQNKESTDILSIAIGLISLYLCNKIYENSTIPRNIKQLTLISFCFAYFIILHAPDVNISGEPNYLAALIFPYLTCLLVKSDKLAMQIITGILAGLIIGINWYYLILPLAFEIILPIFNKNSPTLNSSWRVKFIRNFTALATLILMFIATKPIFNFNLEIIANNNFLFLKQAVFIILLMCVIARNLIKNYYHLQILTIATLSTAIALIVENKGLAAQFSDFFTIALPLIFAIIFYELKENKINWRKNFILIFLCLIIPHFDAQKIFTAMFELCLFWWLALFLIKKIDWYLVGMAVCSIIITTFDVEMKISWLFCALMMLEIFKIYVKNYYDKASLVATSLSLSYLVYLI